MITVKKTTFFEWLVNTGQSSSGACQGSILAIFVFLTKFFHLQDMDPHYFTGLD